jgi:hypothetical protein
VETARVADLIGTTISFEQSIYLLEHCLAVVKH